MQSNCGSMFCTSDKRSHYCSIYHNGISSLHEFSNHYLWHISIPNLALLHRICEYKAICSSSPNGYIAAKIIEKYNQVNHAWYTVITPYDNKPQPSSICLLVLHHSITGSNIINAISQRNFSCRIEEAAKEMKQPTIVKYRSTSLRLCKHKTDCGIKYRYTNEIGITCSQN